MPNQKDIPLEDEVGDVLEKAIRGTGITLEALAVAAAVPAARIRDAVDYRSDLGAVELGRVAGVLGLNEVGLCALGAGRYPLPEIAALPFRVWPLRMRHGIGVANAYLVAEPGATQGVLFDTGAGIAALEAAWPPDIRAVAAIFLTHVEGEHAGGLCAVLARFGAPAAFIPRGARAPGGQPAGEGEAKIFGALEVAAYSTPGHAAAHNCYLVRMPTGADRRGLLISGDLVFAGSAGGGYFSPRQVRAQLRRILDALPPETVIAPGHGPRTTV